MAKIWEVADIRFEQGIEAFNQQQFYECHDLLEAIWMESIERDRNFYQGILQIAVACYHLGNGNWRGAVVLLGEGIRRLADYQPTYYGLDVSQLRTDSYQLLQDLQPMTDEQFTQFVQRLASLKAEDGSKIHTSLSPSPLPKIVRISA